MPEASPANLLGGSIRLAVVEVVAASHFMVGFAAPCFFSSIAATVQRETRYRMPLKFVVLYSVLKFLCGGVARCNSPVLAKVFAPC